MTPRVAVVVLNYNGLEDTLACLQSLRALADPIDLILVDNGSAVDPGEEAARVYPAVEVLRTGANLGYAGGNNRGIARALERGADHVLVLNNDTTVDPGIVRTLVAAFETDPALGIVGPVINFMDEPAVVMTDGVEFNPGPGVEFFRRVIVCRDRPDPDLIGVDIVNGCCMMVSARLFRSIGMFDERLFIVHEEADLCLRALRAGFRNAVVGRSLVWHKGSSAFERSGRQWQRYFDTRNLFHLLRRHAGRASRSRSFGRSVVPFVRYAFYRYDLERDAGKPEAASAVVNGVYDACVGRLGPFVPRPRPFVGVVRLLFATARAAARLTR